MLVGIETNRWLETFENAPGLEYVDHGHIVRRAADHLCTVIFALCHFGTDLIGGNRLDIKIGKAQTYPKSPPTINFSLVDLLDKKNYDMSSIFGDCYQTRDLAAWSLNRLLTVSILGHIGSWYSAVIARAMCMPTSVDSSQPSVS